MKQIIVQIAENDHRNNGNIQYSNSEYLDD